MTPHIEPDIRNASITHIQEADTTAPPLSPTATRVPFRSPLSDQMNRRQENALAEEVMRQFEMLDSEMGRTATDTSSTESGQEWYSGRSAGRDREKCQESFFGKRMIYELTYQNKLEWRRSIPNSVFKDSNLTLSTSRRITNQRIARFTRFFFEVRPWWSAQPVGGRADKEFARTLLKIGDIKLHDSGSASDFRQSITRACIIGEAILHTARVVDDDHYEEELNVLVDTAGNPIVAHDGDYITNDDLWVPAPEMEIAAQDGEGVLAVEIPGKEVLMRDPSTSKMTLPTGETVIETPMGIFKASRTEMRVVPRRAVHYQGGRTSLIHHRDFLCSLAAKDIHSAECIIHLDRIAVSELAAQYAANPSAKTIRQAVDMVNNALRGSSHGGGSRESTEAAAGAARPSLGEDDSLFEMNTGMLDVAHCYLKCDPANSGITRDVYILMDLKSRVPLYYNYTAVASPTRRRPYQVVRSNAVDGRWYGQGEMEQFANASMLIDLFLCRAALTQSRSGRIIGWKPERTLEGQKNPKLRIEWGDTVTPIGDWKLEDCVQVIYIQDNKSNDLHRTLELLNQAATNESGTANANDAAAAGLDTQETATGINNINNAGNELTSLPVAVLREGLTAALDDFMFTTYRFHDETETFSILEGDVPELLQVTKRELSGLRVNVSIQLTSYYADQRAQQTQNAIVLFKDWRATVMTDPQGAIEGRGLYIDAMQSHAIEDADEYIIPPQPTLAPIVPETDTVEPGSPPAENAGNEQPPPTP